MIYGKQIPESVIMKMQLQSEGGKLITVLKGRTKISTLLTSREVKGSNPSSIQVELQMSTNSSKNTFKK